MKKIIISLLMVFLFTGCTVKANINIDRDLFVKEEVSMSESQQFFDSYYKSSPNNIIEMILNTKNRKNDLIDNKYQYEKKIVKDFKGVIANRSYSSVSEFVNNSTFSKQVFKDFEYSEEENIITLDAHNFWKPEEDDPERYFYDNLSININVPFIVTENNADKIDKVNNTYTWKIDANTKDKSIVLKFDKNRLFIKHLDLYISLAIILVISIGFLIWYSRIKKANKINNRI